MRSWRSIPLGILLAVGAIFAASACRTDSLDEAYKRLYLSKYALDFPASEKDLDRCVRNKVKACLDLVETARKGKQLLQAVEPNKALQRTLETIIATCPSEEQSKQEACLGAIVALYFFREPEQDARILQKLIKADRQVLRKVFGPSPFAWYNNRPAPEVWIAALKELPPDYFPRNGKDPVLRAFGNTSREHLDDGVRLL